MSLTPPASAQMRSNSARSSQVRDQPAPHQIERLQRSKILQRLQIRDPLEVYRPYPQMEFVIGMYAYIRTGRSPEQAFSSVRRVVNDLDPNIPLFEMKTLDAQVEESLITERLVMTLSTAFGMLAAIGLYGVMVYLVTLRTREIGLRIALGAATSNVVLLMMKEVFVLAGIGIAIALAGSWGLTRLVTSQLYEIEPNDALTIAGATVAIALVALLAGYLPARRATMVDPMQTLRWE